LGRIITERGGRLLMSKINEKAYDLKEFKTDYIQLQLEIYDGKGPQAQRKFFGDALEEIEVLKRQKWGLRQKVDNLRLRFNREMFNRYPQVVAKYSREIVIWEIILYESMKECEKWAKKEKKKVFEFLYTTTAEKLGDRFGLSYYRSRQVMSRLEEMGAWQKVDTLPSNVGVYSLGKRWRNDANILVDSVLFRLKNPKTKQFFYREMRKIG
jgi:hypothetical protein